MWRSSASLCPAKIGVWLTFGFAPFQNQSRLCFLTLHRNMKISSCFAILTALTDSGFVECLCFGKNHCYFCQFELWGPRLVNQTSWFWHLPHRALLCRHHSISSPRKWICWHTGKGGAETSMQGQGLSRCYYWISVLTFNLFLWGCFL